MRRKTRRRKAQRTRGADSSYENSDDTPVRARRFRHLLPHERSPQWIPDRSIRYALSPSGGPGCRVPSTPTPLASRGARPIRSSWIDFGGKRGDERDGNGAAPLQRRGFPSWIARAATSKTSGAPAGIERQPRRVRRVVMRGSSRGCSAQSSSPASAGVPAEAEPARSASCSFAERWHLAQSSIPRIRSSRCSARTRGGACSWQP